MSRQPNSKPLPLHFLEGPLMKVNEILNSIYGMHQTEVAESMEVCSKIVSQLLHNELIDRISSLNVIKLLCFELILLISDEAAEPSPRLESLECAFGHNRKLRLTVSMRNNLAGIAEVLEQLVWRSADKRKASLGGNSRDQMALQKYYLQFKNLFEDFERCLQQPEPDPVSFKSSGKKSQNAEDSSSGDQNQALIEQLEQIVAKKEKRIKELTEQLEQNILEQKSHEDLISELESRNVDLKEEVRLLNEKLGQSQKNQVHLQDKIEQLKVDLLIKQKQTAKKSTAKTEKSYKSQIIDDSDEPPIRRDLRQYYGERQEKTQTCQQCEAKRGISLQDVNGLRRMLLAQAVSIEALI